jgi:hypothetical protein
MLTAAAALLGKAFVGGGEGVERGVVGAPTAGCGFG